jgi:hemerythrin-like domain-containing protein
MSATEDLLQDHVFIRRLQAVIEKCYTLLYEGKDVPFGDLIKITDMIEQFVDQSTTARRRTATFRKPKARITIRRRSESS